LLAGIGDQFDFLEPQRYGQNRISHVDVVVEGEAAHHVARCIGDASKPARQPGAGFGFDVGSEGADHIVEQTDLVLAVAVGTDHDQRSVTRQSAWRRCSEVPVASDRSRSSMRDAMVVMK
jgi:hypothetical protein